MTIRLRIRELMKARGIQTAAELVVASRGRLSERTCYRIAKADGAVANFSAVTIEALCDVFGVGVGDLFERTDKRSARKGR